jgi:preprotein translocase subunit SecA
LLEYLNEICIPDNSTSVEELKVLSDEEIKEKLLAIATDVYSKKENEFGEEQIREIERVILLRIVDTKWMDHIDNMDHLKQGMNLRAYRQQDPVQSYQFEGSQMFSEMIYNIRAETVKYLFHVQISRAPERERVAKVIATNHDESVENQPIRRKEEKIGRNDPCPCGSGKKYKNCHGRRA